MSAKIASYLILVVACGAIYFTVRLFRRQRLTIGGLLVWTVLWGSMGLFAIYPAALDLIMQLVSMRERLVFLFVGAIVLLYAVSFYVSSRVSEADRKIARLSQEIAILKYRVERGIDADRSKQG